MTPQQKPSQTVEDDNQQPKTARKVTPDALADCGARLRAGDLVAFPTETVYGLGCHALDPVAVQKVFAAKERPLTDPLIVHVAQAQEALPLWQQGSSSTIIILQTLTDAFWPGPLTLVAKAAPRVPSILMANTGYVACRCPQHELAQALIRQARVPIAAPSANKFGHVSPTRADHVLDDLGQENVWVLQDNDKSDASSDSTSSTVTCQVGVESTVAKLEQQQDDNSQFQFALTILRQGAISVHDLQECLTQAGLADQVSVASLSRRTVQETQATVAPGQTIKHYSPRIPSFLVAPSLVDETPCEMTQKLLQQSIVLDFGGRLVAHQSMACQYRDLSSKGNSQEAAQCVFDALRWAERVDDQAKYIVFPQLATDEQQGDDDDALTLALQDRLTRAASGVVLDSIESMKQHIPSLESQ